MTTYTYNDGGRAAAGFKGEARDCVARAIAIATETPYEEVYRALRVACKARADEAAGALSGPRTGVHKGVYRSLLASLGWVWTPTMAVGQGCKVHLRAEELPPGRLIVRCSRHLVAVIDGVIHDTHDSSRGGTRCVYGFWRKA